MRASSSENIRQLESKLNYSFKRKALIGEALTHKSHAKESTKDTETFNERLEFLGDAVLELAVCDYLFRTYRQYTEAEFSKIKAYAVQEATLAEAASRLGIGDFLHLGKGEEASGGRRKPSILANAFEAILAAVYLDGGFKKAREFAIKNLEGKIKTLIDRGLLFDFKSRLQEIVQERFGVLPMYRVHREEGPEHMKIFEIKVFVKKTCYGNGRGKSKKEAEQTAAGEALKKITAKDKNFNAVTII